MGIVIREDTQCSPLASVCVYIDLSTCTTHGRETERETENKKPCMWRKYYLSILLPSVNFSHLASLGFLNCNKIVPWGFLPSQRTKQGAELGVWDVLLLKHEHTDWLSAAHRSVKNLSNLKGKKMNMKVKVQELKAKSVQTELHSETDYH